MSAFRARYPARCAVCDERIEVDDLVLYEDDELVHADCAEAPAPYSKPPGSSDDYERWLGK